MVSELGLVSVLFGIIQIKCGVGLVVEYVLAKDGTRVRFPYPAQITKTSTEMCWFLLFDVGYCESKNGAH